MIERSSIWTLKGISGEFQGNTLALSQDQITIGRTSKNDIIINDHNISRIHVTFFVNDENVFIQDEGSRNGTLVNETKLLPKNRTKLQHGDRILIAQHAFVVELVEKIDPEALKKAAAASKPEVSFRGETTNHHSVFSESGDWKSRFKDFQFSNFKWNRRTIMYTVMGVVIVGVMISKIPSNPSKKNSLSSQNQQIEIKEQNFKSQNPEAMDAGDIEAMKLKAKAATQFQDYLAATELYAKIAQADPKNDYIQTQYEYARKQLSKAISQHLEYAKREYEKLNYERAIIEWKQVLALTVKANPEVYKQTQQKIADAEKEMRKRRG